MNGFEAPAECLNCAGPAQPYCCLSLRCPHWYLASKSGLMSESRWFCSFFSLGCITWVQVSVGLWSPSVGHDCRARRATSHTDHTELQQVFMAQPRLLRCNLQSKRLKGQHKSQSKAGFFIFDLFLGDASLVTQFKCMANSFDWPQADSFTPKRKSFFLLSFAPFVVIGNNCK